VGEWESGRVGDWVKGWLKATDGIAIKE